MKTATDTIQMAILCLLIKLSLFVIFLKIFYSAKIQQKIEKPNKHEIKSKINKETYCRSMFIPNKKSARWYAIRHQDIYTDLGFDYHGKVFEKTTSPVIMENKVNKSMLSRIEPMITYLIDKVKSIKLQYMFSLDKNDTRLN